MAKPKTAQASIKPKKPQKTIHLTKSEEETKKLASKILKELKMKGVICLYGPLGAGKTTFVKGIAELLNLPEMAIKSPTYTYIREYITPDCRVYHFDLYRLEGKPLLARNMVQEVMERDPDLLIIEWPEFLESHIPESRTDIRLKVRGAGEREIEIKHLRP